jgi:hypothetical protein
MNCKKIVNSDCVHTIEWEDYDPRFSRDGGSYYQPTHIIEWSEGRNKFTLTIEDTSCGDFGARVFAQLDKDDCCVAQALYGSLADSRFTDFSADHMTALKFAESIGYHIPMVED